MANPPFAAYPALTHEEILYRVLKNRDYADKGKPFAFLLGKHEVDSGLSVAFNCTSDQAEAVFESTFGSVSLVASKTAQIDGLGGSKLAVIPDSPTHANITNIPHKDDYPTDALRIAEALAAISDEVIVRERRKFWPQPLAQP